MLDAESDPKPQVCGLCVEVRAMLRGIPAPAVGGGLLASVQYPWPALLALLTACGGGLVNTDVDEDTASDDGIPNAYIDVSTIDFGSVEQLRIASENVKLQNTGTGTLEITAIEFSDAAFFASAGAGLNCTRILDDARRVPAPGLRRTRWHGHDRDQRPGRAEHRDRPARRRHHRLRR